MTDHPVTLGDLSTKEWQGSRDSEGRPAHGMAHANCDCMKQRPATVADLVSALRAEGAEQRIENVIDAWAPDLNSYAVERFTAELLDALAEAQDDEPTAAELDRADFESRLP